MVSSSGSCETMWGCPNAARIREMLDAVEQIMFDSTSGSLRRRHVLFVKYRLVVAYFTLSTAISGYTDHLSPQSERIAVANNGHLAMSSHLAGYIARQAHEAQRDVVRQYAPAQFIIYDRWATLLLPIALAGPFVFVYFLGTMASWFSDGFNVHVIYSTFGLTVTIAAGWLANSKTDTIYGVALENFRREQDRRLRQSVAAQRETATSIRELSTAMSAQAQELESLSRSRGDTIIRGDIKVSGAGTVIIASELINSMNHNPDIADALKVVAGFVQDSGSEEAKKCFNELIKRSNNSDDKVVAGALWERLVKLLPSLSSLADAFVKLSSYFGVG
jgi:hypothetical protein